MELFSASIIMTTWQDLILGNQSGGVKRRTRKNAGRTVRTRTRKTRRTRSKLRRISTRPILRRNKRRNKRRKRRSIYSRNNSKNHGFNFSESNDSLRNNIFY